MHNSDVLYFQFYHDPLKYYLAVLQDIEKAKKYIYIETYKFSLGPIGEKFKLALLKKAKEGVEIKLLMDSWGSTVSYSFFSELINAGAEVRYFKKIRISFDFFTKNHRRDHRKIIAIDDEITYMGSANITDHSINWRESIIRINGNITKEFKKIFLENWRIYNKYFYDKIVSTQIIYYHNYEIIRDVPSTLLQPTRKRFLELIQNAKSEIIIETPYFLPGSVVRKAIKEAGMRGVKVTIIMPKRSDVGAVDLLRTRYLGQIYGPNVEILYYIPQNLHAKLCIVDKSIFFIGSANFDYRSFRFQYEISLVGKNKSLISKLLQHVEETKKDCEAFDYEFWKKRSFVQKIFEWLLVPFRHLF